MEGSRQWRIRAIYSLKWICVLCFHLWYLSREHSAFSTGERLEPYFQIQTFIPFERVKTWFRTLWLLPLSTLIHQRKKCSQGDMRWVNTKEGMCWSKACFKIAILCPSCHQENKQTALAITFMKAWDFLTGDWNLVQIQKSDNYFPPGMSDCYFVSMCK